MRAGHHRRGPGFVDEDEAQGIKVELALEPVFPPLPDVGLILLARGRGLLCASACGSRRSAKARRMLAGAPDCANRASDSDMAMSGVSTRGRG